MKRTGLWVLGAALGSFAAGLNVGFAAPDLLLGPGADAAPAGDQDYARSLAADYGLSAEQVRSLWLVLQRGREEERAFWSGVDPASLPPATQSQLLLVRGRTEQRIRAILDDEQRARYDQDSRPLKTR